MSDYNKQMVLFSAVMALTVYLLMRDSSPKCQDVITFHHPASGNALPANNASRSPPHILLMSPVDSW